MLALNACGSSSQSGGSSAKDGIPVGFLNQGQGAAALPNAGAGAPAAVSYLNENGGINGKKINLITCDTDGTPATSVACANRFVQEKVAVVIQGIDLGSDSAVPILAGANIPLVGHTAFGPVQSNSSSAFFFGAAPGAYTAGPAVVVSKNMGLKSLAFTNIDAPPARAYTKIALEPVAKALGLGLDVSYYPAAAPNYSSVMASLLAKRPDAVLIIGPEQVCTGMLQAAKNLGYQGKILAGSCSAFIKADPASAEGVFTASDLYQAGDDKVPADKKAELAIYDTAMAKNEKYKDGFSQNSFSAMMDLGAVLKSTNGDYSSSAILTALRNIRGMSSFMGQTLNCDGKQWPGEKAICGSGLIEYQVKDGRLSNFTNGFVDPSKYLG
ncbi:ABC transporter substrate-binding protein [Amycolatopsis japonica]|uniref:ABC transporter substrate-binding protein n=1 Tax=Amycolatopsis japonica TaxID=208439 RepID=UPI00366D7D90